MTISALIAWLYQANGYVYAILLGTGLYGAIGFYDDYTKIRRFSSRGISAKMRLLLQFIFTYLLVRYIGAEHSRLNIAGDTVRVFGDFVLNFGCFYSFFATILIVGTANSVNLTDGLDGLVAIPACLVLSCLAITSYAMSDLCLKQSMPNLSSIAGSQTIGYISLVLSGSILGFLWFNIHPARLFMGDTGSLAIGGCIGTLTIVLKQEGMLFIAGMFFVLEAVSVILQIGSFKLRKKRVFLMAPIHHHFEKKGYTEVNIVMKCWLFSLIMAILSLYIFLR